MARRRTIITGLTAGVRAFSSLALATQGASLRAARATAAVGTRTVSSALAVPVNPRSDVGETTTILNPGVVVRVHFGDLHITTANQQNYADFKSI